MSVYTEAVAAGLEGMIAVSTGSCPRCAECMEHDGCTDADEHERAWHRGDTCSDTHFSWRACGICGTRLGGDRERWHWIDPKDPERAINHEDDCCVDCIYYIAYGTEPEEWRESA